MACLQLKLTGLVAKYLCILCILLHKHNACDVLRTESDADSPAAAGLLPLVKVRVHQSQAHCSGSCTLRAATNHKHDEQLRCQRSAFATSAPCFPTTFAAALLHCILEAPLPLCYREVAGGTNRVKQVLAAFRDAGAKLHQAQFLGQPGGCLRALFDMDAAVHRDPKAAGQVGRRTVNYMPILFCFLG
jgi:hypothetical protein